MNDALAIADGEDTIRRTAGSPIWTGLIEFTSDYGDAVDAWLARLPLPGGQQP